jgi:GAF domain-containing protein
LGNALVGVLAIGYPAGRRFDDTEFALLQVIANQVAQGIVNAQLLDIGSHF